MDLAALVVLADLPTAAIRTALTGTSTFADALIICPGLHRQQDAPRLSEGEFPICAAMTTGYVFRVENEATVFYLQRVGRAGHLTTVQVSSNHAKQPSGSKLSIKRAGAAVSNSVVPTLSHVVATILTMIAVWLLVLVRDWWGVTTISILVFARLLNILVIKDRSTTGWKGAAEPGKHSDLIILLSRDRWIRMQGLVDDVKVVTSGSWLLEPTFLDSVLTAIATLLVYLDVVLTANATNAAKLLLLLLLFSSAALLGLANACTTAMKMYGRTLRVVGPPQPYKRRLHLAKQLVEESGSSDWAIRLGIVQESDVHAWQTEKPSDQAPSEKSSNVVNPLQHTASKRTIL